MLVVLGCRMPIDRHDELTIDLLDGLGLSRESVLCEPIPKDFNWQEKEVCLTGFFQLAKASNSKRLPVVVKLLEVLGASVTESWRFTTVDVLLVGQRLGLLKKKTKKLLLAEQHNTVAEEGSHIYIFSEAAVMKSLNMDL